MTLPLEGVRILALTQLGAGPYAMTVLGDLGAEIIKIEDPATNGDEARRVPPMATEGDSPYFQALNRNAKSLSLNLRIAEGREVFQRLVEVADAVYANTRGDLPAKLGLDYAQLQAHNPRIVCCSLSGFGRTGPRATEPAYDFIVQAMAGFMSLTGEPDAPPTRCGVSIVDFSGGLMSALGMMVGILRARETGVGCDVDVSLLDTAVSMLNYLAALNLNYGHGLERLPSSAHQTLVPSQNFRTKDGHLVVMCMKEKFWQRLAELIGLRELIDDPRFRTFRDRLEHRPALIDLLQGVLSTRTTSEWIAVLRGEVPCAPVYSVGEALADEQILAREMVIEVMHPHFGPLKEVGCPVKIDAVKPRYEPTSAYGADTEELLSRVLGLSSDEIRNLRISGAI